MSLNQKSQKNKSQSTHERAKKPKAQKAQQVNMDQVRSAPETLSQEDVLKAQQKLGNQTVQRTLGAQAYTQGTNIAVGQEEEETLGHEVGHVVQQISEGDIAGTSVTDEQGYLNDEISNQIQSSRGGGSPLPTDLQQESAEKLSHDFDDVRIHTDSTADKLSRQINAKAFTIGKDIFFKDGEYKPGSSKGRETLMHELTHVVQQSGSAHTGSQLKLGETDTTHEKEAENMSKRGGEAKAASGAVGAVQRVTQEELDAQMKKMGLGSQEHKDKMTQLEETGRTGPTELEDKVSGMNLGSEEHMAKLDQLDQPKKEGFNEFDLRAQRNKMGIGSESQLKKLDALDERQSSNMKKNYMEGRGSKDVSKGRLVAKINDPNASEEEVAQAKNQLNDLYGSKTNSFKEFFGKGMGSKEIDNRRNMLKQAAQRGEEGSYEKYQEFQKANPTGWEKFKGGVSSGAKKAFGFLKGNAGKLGGLFPGATKEKEEASSAPAPQASGVNINMGGGGGGGMATMMQEYARVLEENKKLKEQLGQTGEKKEDEGEG